jgi:hypothetical protein
MTTVLFPFQEIFYRREVAMFKLCVETLCKAKTNQVQLVTSDVGKEYIVCHVEPARGKNELIELSKKLGFTHTYFIKNNMLYKKYSDTGIVDKLGIVEYIDNVYKLKDV